MPNFPATAVVPTIDRTGALNQALGSLLEQEYQPKELIVVDASHDERTRNLIEIRTPEFAARGCRLMWQKAIVRGAAPQRNQGIATGSQPIVWFFDDDILFESHCVERLWAALCSDPSLGGVNAMIVNERYRAPGPVSHLMLRTMFGKPAASYAGRVLGPGINFLPEDRDDLPDVVAVEWLNAGCTMYRREALPDPVFPNWFTGYSLGEDLALSLVVSRRWKLANARTARIIHDSQPGSHKNDPISLSRMALCNRYFIMVHVLGRRKLSDHVKLVCWELFQLVALAVQCSLSKPFWQTLWGKILGCNEVYFGGRRA